ncbi:LicD family protein [Bacteroidales bacterium OttesenSCG-928-B11]|nr:LicD family protein [Bacteroidales bacterium OttesenSCG-928-E04]MDL2309148.1 LicD family protein [Bacteroidales bacterium OttesenSCG-928-C03]MDL2312242.1 LicD family protein [Bacteroidales bacterium OttesenSCG-928-B11]
MKEDFSKYNGEGTPLRKAQLRMLEILIEVDRICKKHNIPYWLDSGTLLGAVRHGGFIPWDDDLDITVMRKDYKRLRKVLQEELPEQFVFQDWTTDKYAFDHYGRVKDTKSLFDYPRFRMQQYRGLHLDIFVVEKGISMRVKKKIDFLFGRVFRTLNNYGYVVCHSTLKRKFIYLSAIFLAPIVYLLVGLERLVAKMSANDLLILSFGTNFYSKRHKSDIFPLQEIEFEGHLFYSPNNVHEFLTHIYGEYQKLPPEEQRMGHGVKVEVYD